MSIRATLFFMFVFGFLTTLDLIFVGLVLTFGFLAIAQSLESIAKSLESKRNKE